MIYIYLILKSIDKSPLVAFFHRHCVWTDKKENTIREWIYILIHISSLSIIIFLLSIVSLYSSLLSRSFLFSLYFFLSPLNYLCVYCMPTFLYIYRSVIFKICNLLGLSRETRSTRRVQGFDLPSFFYLYDTFLLRTSLPLSLPLLLSLCHSLSLSLPLSVSL